MCKHTLLPAKYFLNNVLSNNIRMQNIVVHVCPMNFFYVFIVPGPILRHLGEFGKIRGKYTFFANMGQSGYLKDGL